MNVHRVHTETRLMRLSKAVNNAIKAATKEHRNEYVLKLCHLYSAHMLIKEKPLHRTLALQRVTFSSTCRNPQNAVARIGVPRFADTTANMGGM